MADNSTSDTIEEVGISGPRSTLESSNSPKSVVNGASVAQADAHTYSKLGQDSEVRYIQ